MVPMPRHVSVSYGINVNAVGDQVYQILSARDVGPAGCRRFTLRHIDYMKGTRELMSIINAAEGTDAGSRNSVHARVMASLGC
jgi:hypothetical protein